MFVGICKSFLLRTQSTSISKVAESSNQSDDDDVESDDEELDNVIREVNE